MPKLAAVKAGRGFIVKHAGDWFRVPRKLVKSGKIDPKALLKHNDEMLKKMNAKRVAKGCSWARRRVAIRLRVSRCASR